MNDAKSRAQRTDEAICLVLEQPRSRRVRCGAGDSTGVARLRGKTMVYVWLPIALGAGIGTALMWQAQKYLERLQE